MLLIEEVRRLRKIFPRIIGAKIGTPLMGGGVDDIYEFIGDMVLVREIWARIIFCDPDASKFPKIKRTMEVDFTNDKGKTEKIRKKVDSLLGMIVHGKYLLSDSNNTLDVINDRGERFRGSFKEFTTILESLLLDDNDVIFAMCAVVRRQIKKIKKAHKRLNYDAHEKYYKEIYILWDANVGANLDWLLDHYFGSNGIARKDLKPFLPEDQKEKNFYRFYFTNRNIVNTRYNIKFGGAWGQGMDEKCWIGCIDVNILLSIIEKHIKSPL